MLLPTYVFFSKSPATTEIYTLSLHDALPILRGPERQAHELVFLGHRDDEWVDDRVRLFDQSGASRTRSDRKSTRLNSSHLGISYAVFCLKKKKKKNTTNILEHSQHIHDITHK